MSSGEHSSLGLSHSWGERDSHKRQQCVNCDVWKMSPRIDLVYYSRTPSLTGTWSVMRPPCRRKEEAA